MSKAKPLPQIDFAKKHITSDISTFDAASALLRLEILLDDAVEVGSHLSPILKENWQPAFFEFVTYYQVGIVTCLEWHAKSRLYDLFVFDPKQITTADIKQGLSDSKISQMVSEGLTIPHLIASSFSVSSLEKYVLVIERVLKALGASRKIGQMLDTEISEDTKLGEILADLYEERNSLVHEISLHDIGHRHVRNYKDFNEIVVIGRAALRFMKEVEFQITDNAPVEFPNLLDKDGFSISPVERLYKDIKTLEVVISDAVRSDEYQGEFTDQDWDSIVNKSRIYLGEEVKFIESLSLAGWQYYDIRPKLLYELLNSRINYLKSLSNEILPLSTEESAG